jgi:hypothetical protein
MYPLVPHVVGATTSLMIIVPVSGTNWNVAFSLRDKFVVGVMVIIPSSPEDSTLFCVT